MNKKINKIITNLENCFGIFDYSLTPTESNLLVSYIKELQQENKQLRDNIRQMDNSVDKLQIQLIEELKDNREAKVIKDYLVDVIDGVYGNTLGDNKENYFDKLAKGRD